MNPLHNPFVRRAAWMPLAAWLMAHAALASESPPAAASTAPGSNPGTPAKASLPEPWMYSASGLFRCTGGTRVQAMDLLGLADRVAQRLEAMLGRPIPRPPGYPVYLAIHPLDAQATQPAFSRRHLLQPGGWAHRMDIWGLEDAPAERVTLELVHLLLERYAVYQQAPEAREAHPASPPMGLCGGVARVIFPALRDTALHSARQSWREGAGGNPVRLWQSEQRPAPPDDALAGAAVEWIQSRNPGALREMIENIARNKTITFDLLAGILQLPDGDAAQRDWHLWMAMNESRLTPWIQTPAERAADIRRALTVDRGIWPHLAPPSVPEIMGPDILIEHRNEDWVRGMVPLMIHQLRSVPTGDLQDLDRAAHILDEALRFLRYPEAPAPLKWIPSPSRSRTIRKQIERAYALIQSVESAPAVDEPTPMDATPAVKAEAPQTP